MRIYLDDLRDPPREYYGEPLHWDAVCRTAREAIALVNSGKVTFIDFDHDLGDGEDGIAVAKRVEELAAQDKIGPIGWSIHSGNIVGSSNIDKAMKSAWRFWDKGEERV